MTLAATKVVVAAVWLSHGFYFLWCFPHYMVICFTLNMKLMAGIVSLFVEEEKIGVFIIAVPFFCTMNNQNCRWMGRIQVVGTELES